MASDFGVIGAGIVGLATAFALTERGASVTVYERGVPGNGQSGGESRIFRHFHDDARLVAFACEARLAWRDWEERFGEELLSRDGVVALGEPAQRRLAILQQVGGVRARPIDAGDLPLLGRRDVPAVLDEDGGVIRTRATIEALTRALRDSLVFDEVMSVRPRGDAVEVRAAGVAAEHARVLVCAGRGTAALARGAGMPLPIRQSAHVRLTYAVRGEPPDRLPCLMDGEAGAYGDPLPGNAAFAVGLEDVPVHDDGSVLDPAAFAAATERTNAYVADALPGLDPTPTGARHCWVTELPWSPDGIAAWDAGGLRFVAGGNLFKHAPALGRALAEEDLPPLLRPEAKLGAAFR